MGLKISRDALAHEGYSLTLDDPRQTKGAVFRLAPGEQEEE